MPKLKLNLEDVSVESFETAAPDPREQGTVRGQQYSTMRYTCDPGGCGQSLGCATAFYCYQSDTAPCATATCPDGCTADCPTYPAQTWNQTCPPTCDWGYGCAESGYPDCPQ